MNLIEPAESHRFTFSIAFASRCAISFKIRENACYVVRPRVSRLRQKGRGVTRQQCTCVRGTEAGGER